jgi:hypothetical protein
MNAQYLFLWNDGYVWKVSLATRLKTRMSLAISLNEKMTKIVLVRTGSNADFVSIRVKQTPTEHCVIQWDIERDLEMQSFDCAENALFFQDEKGNPFLAERDVLIMMETGARIKCYNFDVAEFSQAIFDFGLGNRIEIKTHNWLIFRNFINLSFSYMTFVIKENFDEGYINKDFLFDLEGYDFIYDRETMFTSDNNLVTLNYEKLLFILQHYEA